MLTAAATTVPACFGLSFFAPGEGPCNTGCSLAQRCRATYFESALRVLASEPTALAEDEHAYLLTQQEEAEKVTPEALCAPERAHIEELCARAAGVVRGGCTPSAPRKAPERWTEARRRPLSSFKPTSVPALAAEVLRSAARPLHVRDVTAEVQALAAARGARLGGRTPEATVGLSLRRIQGVEQVGRGTYLWTVRP